MFFSPRQKKRINRSSHPPSGAAAVSPSKKKVAKPRGELTIHFCRISRACGRFFGGFRRLFLWGRNGGKKNKGLSHPPGRTFPFISLPLGNHIA